MNRMLVSGLVGLTMGVPATAAADICADISSGGTVSITKNASTEGCTASLSKDTVVQGDGKSVITTGKHGVMIKLNGHKLTVKDVKIDFSGDYALAVHGNDSASDGVTFTNVTLNDKATVDCKSAEDRVGAIVWKVKTATIAMTASNAKVRHGLVVGGPVPKNTKSSAFAAFGTATVSGAIAYCKGSWPQGDKAVLGVGRVVTWNGSPITSVGPDDMNSTTLSSIYSSGTP